LKEVVNLTTKRLGRVQTRGRRGVPKGSEAFFQEGRGKERVILVVMRVEIVTARERKETLCSSDRRQGRNKSDRKKPISPRRRGRGGGGAIGGGGGRCKGVGGWGENLMGAGGRPRVAD